ncbi:23710_t:CDS:1 [Racocetra persica]|uniref:23710_t:CDS:1 n=1 Tax=Racocetra persica TaxID=160502 RepID=A0ACA9NUJ8_9GLOM|nr:23710_t:CDS:1 [Racocetra persica]
MESEAQLSYYHPKKSLIKEISEKNVDKDKRNVLRRFRSTIAINIPLFGFLASFTFFLKNPHQHQPQKKSINLFLVTCFGFCALLGLYHFGYNNSATNIIIQTSSIASANDITQNNIITRDVSMNITLQEFGMTKIDKIHINATSNNSHAMSLDCSPISASVAVDDKINLNDGLNKFKEELDNVISFFTSLNSQPSDSEILSIDIEKDDVDDDVKQLACMSSMPSTRVKVRRENVNGFTGMRPDKLQI